MVLLSFVRVANSCFKQSEASAELHSAPPDPQKQGNYFSDISLPPIISALCPPTVLQVIVCLLHMYLEAYKLRSSSITMTFTTRIFFSQAATIAEYSIQDSLDSSVELHTYGAPTRFAVVDRLRKLLGEPHSMVYFFSDSMTGDVKPELIVFDQLGDNSAPVPTHNGSIHVLFVRGTYCIL